MQCSPAGFPRVLENKKINVPGPENVLEFDKIRKCPVKKST